MDALDSVWDEVKAYFAHMPAEPTSDDWERLSSLTLTCLAARRAFQEAYEAHWGRAG